MFSFNNGKILFVDTKPFIKNDEITFSFTAAQADPRGGQVFFHKYIIEMKVLAESLYDLKLFIFISGTFAMLVIVLHHWCVPQPSGGPFCAHSMAGEGAILVNLCLTVSSHACVLGTRIHWRAIGSSERVPVLSCGPAIVHLYLPCRPPPPTCPRLRLLSSAQLN